MDIVFPFCPLFASDWNDKSPTNLDESISSMNKKGRKLIEIMNCMELFGKKNKQKKHNK